MKTLKDKYHLDYDTSPLNSGLTKWYNVLITKTTNELDITDVSRMVRQNILEDVAVTRAIDLFIQDPFGGEMLDGDLLSLIINQDPAIVKNSDKHKELLKTIQKLELNGFDNDWLEDDNKTMFQHNIALLKRLVMKD